MVKEDIFTVRPYAPAKASLKESLRIYLSATAVQSHGYRAGDVCQLRTPTDTTFLVVVWPAKESIQKSIVQLPKFLQYEYGLKLGDEIHVSRVSGPVGDAGEVTLTECKGYVQESSLEKLQSQEEKYWAWLLEYELEQAELICPGMFLGVRAKGLERVFRIATVNGSDRQNLYRSLTIRHVAISSGVSSQGTFELRTIDHAMVGGLGAQLAKLNSVLAMYNPSVDSDKVNTSHRPRRGGVVIHGPSGTGKTMLLRLISEAGWRKVFHIQNGIFGARVGGEHEAVRQIFRDAHCHQPSVIIIDDLDTIARKEETYSSPQSLTKVLCDGLDGRGDSQILVIGATRDLALVHDTVRRPKRLALEIELPVPGTDARLEILGLAVGSLKSSQSPRLWDLANRTPGFVGSDLDELAQVAMDNALLRLRGSDKGRRMDGNLTFEEAVTEADIETALNNVKPTAMKEIYLDTPRVRWSDIGGQADVKRALQEAVEWPIEKERSRLKRLGCRPRKGLLLYGPPGCSKTLAAKAVATEAKLNFIAVKGAEVLSMYVGESERNIREIFRKARVASPSVIFFDEIDAVGARQDLSPQGGVHVLTTILNEMDGIEARQGVFVLAATNRPDMLDPALLRPGRLDSAVYVGLPDYQARFEIVAIEARKMDVEEDFSIASLADVTDGYSGAELVNVCQGAAYATVREELECGSISKTKMKHFLDALGTVKKQTSPEMIYKYKEWGARGQYVAAASSGLSVDHS
ncbi:MAG: hypothetical protein Q9183_001013 [Haloplaca sp. 2 TL-2023]